jgi:hypothetical protein
MNPLQNIKRIMPWLLGGFALLLFGHGTYFLVGHLAALGYLKEEVMPRVDGQSEAEILESALFVAFDIPPHRDAGNAPDYGIQHPILRVLGPSADLIHMKGGHCGRRARLLMAILEQYDIPARKVHLINDRFAEFNHNHHYVHAVVEARIDGEWVVADPLYNIIYRTPQGALASLRDIQQDRERVFLATIASADTLYSPYFAELYTFDQYRKFIWNSFPGGEQLYELMENVIGPERARELPGPAVIEKPLLAVAGASYAAASVLFFGALLSGGVSRRKMRPG